MKDRGISGESTFYNYTLTGRVASRPAIVAGYGALLLLFVAGELAVSPAWGIVYAALSGAVIPAMHVALTFVLLRATRDATRGQWSWRRQLPCCGYLPSGFAGMRALTRLHLHLLAIGFAWIALLYVWTPLPLFCGMAFLHLWLLAPRLYVLYRFRKLRAAGLVKWHDGGASFYIP